MALGRLLLALGLPLLCHGVIAGLPGPGAAELALTERLAPRKLHGRFLHITGRCNSRCAIYHSAEKPWQPIRQTH